MDGVISTPVVSTASPAASTGGSGLSTGAKFALGALVVAAAAGVYFFYLYEKDPLSFDAKFSREIKFIKGDTETTPETETQTK